jgi:anti-sigma B factor antagonist
MPERQFSLTGELDLADVPALREQLARTTEGDVDLCVDCAGLTFVDSSVISVLVDVDEQLEARGNKLIVVNLDPRPRRVFTLLGLDHMTGDDRIDAR